jgi:hypothetical protein
VIRILVNEYRLSKPFAPAVNGGWFNHAWLAYLTFFAEAAGGMLGDGAYALVPSIRFRAKGISLRATPGH